MPTRYPGKQFVQEWLANYRYRGGIPTVLKGLLGTARLELARKPSSRQHGLVDCITFSLVPGLTTLWSHFIFDSIRENSLRVVIGDCSGGLLKTACLHPRAQVLSLYNAQHDYKLDLFMRKVCTAKYVIVSDDDVIWLSELPWNWALEQLESNKNVAAVSLFPRPYLTSVTEGKVPFLMGTYCTVIRREVWLREGLSFSKDKSPLKEGHDWYYDTADCANLALLERGYEIKSAPDEIRESLITMEAISGWTWRIQRYKGDIYWLVRGSPLRQKKALRAVLFLIELDKILNKYHLLTDGDVPLVPRQFLLKARTACEHDLVSSCRDEITQQVQDATCKLNKAMAASVPFTCK